MNSTTMCPICRSVTAKKTDEWVCLNAVGCNRRRCDNRVKGDKKRKVREQCHSTTGGRSVRFCMLTVGHEGKHLNNSKEWGGNYRAPVAQVIRALSMVREIRCLVPMCPSSNQRRRRILARSSRLK
jgi:hypothetical protein